MRDRYPSIEKLEDLIESGFFEKMCCSTEYKEKIKKFIENKLRKPEVISPSILREYGFDYHQSFAALLEIEDNEELVGDHKLARSGVKSRTWIYQCEGYSPQTFVLRIAEGIFRENFGFWPPELSEISRVLDQVSPLDKLFPLKW